MVFFEGEEFLEKNLIAMDKDQFISTVGGYATSGILRHMAELQVKLEQEIKNRLSTFSPEEVTYLIRVMAQSGTASSEYYRMMDKFIGLNLTTIEPKFLFSVLKSFFDSGFARQKLFIKL